MAMGSPPLRMRYAFRIVYRGFYHAAERLEAWRCVLINTVRDPFVGELCAEPAIWRPEVAVFNIAVARFGAIEESRASTDEGCGLSVYLAAVPAVSQTLNTVVGMSGLAVRTRLHGRCQIRLVLRFQELRMDRSPNAMSSRVPWIRPASAGAGSSRRLPGIHRSGSR